MSTELPEPTPAMHAYAAWHGMSIAHVQQEWASVPKADRMRVRWEKVAAAAVAAERAAERERCAKLCESIARQYKDGRGHAAERAANAIRGQDQKGQG
jgi:hypothetical protein